MSHGPPTEPPHRAGVTISQPAPFRTGLCSVTLRRLAVPEVLAAAAAAGLECIEWGGDIHVPPGDSALARQVGAATADAGLQVASYGSYFRAGPETLTDFEPAILAAAALGAPRIRIWAGQEASSTASSEAFTSIVATVRAAADIAGDRGLELAFEFHAGTLADTPSTVLGLLEAIDRPNVGTYWQPPEGMPDEDALAGLRQLLDHVRAVHVFSWWPRQERQPLAYRREFWASALRLLRGTGRGFDLLLEFVADDDPALLIHDAATLRLLTEETSQ